MNKFSVLISIYAKENPAFFRLAMDSILNQTLQPSEIVLVKDGPLTEALEKEIRGYERVRPALFRIVTLPENKGLGNALKVGLEACRYDLVARMDTDDVCLPNRFERQMSFLENHPDVDLLGTNMEEFNREPGDLGSFRIMPEQGDALRKYSKFRNPFNHPTVVFRKAAVLRNGSYNGEIPLFEDFSLFLKMIQNGCGVYNMQETLLYFRVGNGMESIKRRSGLHYIKNELKFVRFAYRAGYLTLAEKWLYLITKIPVRLLPPAAVLFIYRRFLRRSK
jgi:glycosyltransferase involved in cell wall biosynthesis